MNYKETYLKPEIAFLLKNITIILIKLDIW